MDGHLDRRAVVGELDGRAGFVVNQVPVGVGLEGMGYGFGETFNGAGSADVGYLEGIVGLNGEEENQFFYGQ